jgi:hypothetical protein
MWRCGSPRWVRLCWGVLPENGISVLRSLRRHHSYESMPVEARLPANAIPMGATGSWITSKTAAVFDHAPKNRVAVTPDLFGFVYQYPPMTSGGSPKNSGIISDILLSCKTPNFENPPINGDCIA